MRRRQAKASPDDIIERVERSRKWHYVALALVVVIVCSYALGGHAELAAGVGFGFLGGYFLATGRTYGTIAEIHARYAIEYSKLQEQVKGTESTVMKAMSEVFYEGIEHGRRMGNSGQN